MSVWHDATIGAIFNQVAKEFGEDPSDVRSIYEEYFKYAAEIVVMPEMPKINLVGVGVLYPKTRPIKCDIDYLEGKEEHAEKRKNLEIVLDRLVKERELKKRKNKCKDSNLP